MDKFGTSYIPYFYDILMELKNYLKEEKLINLVKNLTSLIIKKTRYLQRRRLLMNFKITELWD